MFVPVKTKDGQQLMPMHAARARKLVKRGEATPYFDNGIYCIRLNKEPSGRETQEIAVGVDPGSKKEGFTVKSESHTYLNVQADAHNKVGKKLKSVASCGEVDVHGSVRTARTEPTVLRTENGYLQAHVRGGTGNYGYWIGCLNSIQSRMSVWRILKHALSHIRRNGINRLVLLKLASSGSIPKSKSGGNC